MSISRWFHCITKCFSHSLAAEMPFSISQTIMKSYLLSLCLVAGASVFGAEAQPLYLDSSQPLESHAADLRARLTLEGKVSLVHAKSTFAVAGVPRLGVPDLWMDDGPMGVREEVGEGFRNLNREDDFATAMPATLGLAATFNTELANAYGAVIGQEAKQRGKDIMLGPSLNIQRTPLCGRSRN
jgi:beta-glucosidase